ncbi:MAG: ABC transporter permease [Candidatus Adiutrix sp.]|jgi:ABC-2 type transport system permease protein|nr:ABC transporter permease [Candidatus Adiutrix sp.]
MIAVLRKELGDHFSSARFPLICALIFLAALLSVSLAGDGLRGWLGDGPGLFLEGRLFLLLFTAPGAWLPAFMFVAYLGPLAGLVLGFDSVSRERAQGTLSKILSQPIYRDELLAGKFLAGLLTLAVMAAALLMLITGLSLAWLGLVPTADELGRLFLFWALTVLYLGFWLALGLLSSIVFRGALASALACGALWLSLAFLGAVAAGALAGALAPVNDSLRPTRAELAAREELFRSFSLLSPVKLYQEAAGFLLDPASRSPDQSRQLADPAVSDPYTGRFSGPLPVGQSLVLLMPHLAALLIWAALVFHLSCFIFSRQEIRSSA